MSTKKKAVRIEGLRELSCEISKGHIRMFNEKNNHSKELDEFESFFLYMPTKKR